MNDQWKVSQTSKVFNLTADPKELVGIQYLLSGRANRDGDAMVFPIYLNSDDKPMAGSLSLNAQAQKIRQQSVPIEGFMSCMHLFGSKNILGSAALFEKTFRNDDGTYMTFEQNVAKKIAEIKDAIDRRLEYTFWQFATDGKATTIAGLDQVIVDYDLGMPAGNKIVLTGDDMWDNANADITDELAEIINIFALYGIKDIVAFYPLKAGRAITNWIRANNGLFISEPLKNTLDFGTPGMIPVNWNGINWVQCTHNYRDVNGNLASYLNDNYVYFMPLRASDAWDFVNAPSVLTKSNGWGASQEQLMNPPQTVIYGELNAIVYPFYPKRIVSVHWTDDGEA